MLWFLLLYVAGQLALAIWVSRGTSSHVDYLVAGRNLSVFAVAMSLFATWFASETVLAVASEVSIHGLSAARFEPFGFGLGILLVGLFIALPLRRGEYITLAGFMGARFGSKAETLTALVIAMSSTSWAAAQLYALATIVSAAAGLDFSIALYGAALVVIAYTLLGGLMGDIITDIVQGCVLAIGLVVFAAVILNMAGGVEAAIDKIPREALALRPRGEGWVDSIEVWLIPIFAAIAAQEVIARVLAARSPAVAQKGALLGTAIFLCIGMIPVFIGLIGPHLGFALGEGDTFLPSLAKLTLPHWLYVVFSGALLSAILSTVDSALLAVSAVVIDSGYKRFNPDMTQQQALRAARLATVCAGLIALAVASSADSLRTIAIDTAALGAVLAVPLVIALCLGAMGKCHWPLDGATSIAIVVQIIILLLGGQAMGLAGAFFYAVIAGFAVFFTSIALLTIRRAPHPGTKS